MEKCTWPPKSGEIASAQHKNKTQLKKMARVSAAKTNQSKRDKLGKSRSKENVDIRYF